ncbi:DNA polymerase III subunit beta [Streptomyces capparidis]
MKIFVGHADLATAVGYAARALPHRPPVPVLAGLKLTAADGQLTVAAFDHEVSAYATATARIAAPGSVLVSGRLLADITRALKGEVHLETKGNHLLITAGVASFTLHTLPLQEYPTLPDLPAAAGTVSGKALAAAVAQVAIAASREQALPVLTGIHLAATADTLTLAATDRYRFALRTLPWDCLTDIPDTTHAVIPAKALADTTKDLADDHVAITLPGNSGPFGLLGEHCRTTLRPLDGNLPKYKELFPTEFATQATVPTAPLLQAVKRVALVAERSAPVHLSLAPGAITIRAGVADHAEASDRVDADIDGDPMDLAFNPTYLTDGLHAIDSDTTRLSLTTPTKPALLRGSSDTDDQAMRYLLMPIRLSD